MKPKALPSSSTAAYCQALLKPVTAAEASKILGGNDLLIHCKTPEMVRKEILMHFIVYNCIRNLMVDAVIGKEVNPSRISFKGCIQAVRQ